MCLNAPSVSARAPGPYSIWTCAIQHECNGMDNGFCLWFLRKIHMFLLDALKIGIYDKLRIDATQQRTNANMRTFLCVFGFDAKLNGHFYGWKRLLSYGFLYAYQTSLVDWLGSPSTFRHSNHSIRMDFRRQNIFMGLFILCQIMSALSFIISSVFLEMRNNKNESNTEMGECWQK